MAESEENERPDAAPGGRDDAPRPVQGNEPIDKTGAPGVVSDRSAPSDNVTPAKPSSEVTPHDVATDSDWPGAGKTREQDRPVDEGQTLAQTGQDALSEHAQAQGEARARLTIGTETDPRLPRGEPVGRAGPT